MWTRLKRINFWFDKTSYLKVAIFIKYASENDEIPVSEKYLFMLNLSYDCLYK